MVNNKILNQVKTVSEEFLEKLTISGKCEVTNIDNLIKINITSSDAALLIGKNGETLLSLHYLLVNILYSKLKFDEDTRLLVDVENYRESQKEKLAYLIEKTIESVIKTGRAEVLLPMTSYERKQTHLIISQNNKVETESIGEEPNRRVIVRLKK